MQNFNKTYSKFNIKVQRHNSFLDCMVVRSLVDLMNLNAVLDFVIVLITLLPEQLAMSIVYNVGQEDRS